MPDLETARLRLRPFSRADGEAHVRLYADPEVTRFLRDGPVPADRVAARSREVLDRFIDHWARHGFGPWALLDKADGRVIGQCGLQYLPDGNEVELLYLLERARWGQGLATEAAWAALAHGFETLALPRIVAVTRPEHAASRHVMQKLGMTYKKDVEVYGLHAVYYALTDGDFRRLRGPVLH